ncbi:hypothetical protein V1264_001524 [Littorina saxatilis]|uniref:Ion transport domain-containing protein n=2 Tax=Littorina saxatilis TaxID=31220 RepID=A0AAN9C1M6_9CAEN
MMGELPLSIAALTFEEDMVKLLLHDFKAKIHHTNSAGDTVFHSLIRYSHLYPQKETQAVKMMTYLHHFLLYEIEATDGDELARQVWMIQNNTGFTALKMAALFSQSEAFNFIFNLKGVYCHLGEHDGLFNHLLYDITEIDPAASSFLTRQLEKEKKQKKNQVGPAEQIRKQKSDLKPKAPPEGVNKTSKTHKGSYLKGPELEYKDRTTSVLEIVCETEEAEKAFKILNTYVMRNVLAEEKWQKYRLWFYGCWFCHVVIMVCITTLAVYKARVISYADDTESASATTSASLVSDRDKRVEKNFVVGMSIVTFLVAVWLLVLEGVRWRRRQQPLKLLLPHHNGLYRLLLLVMAVSIVIDSVWNWVRLLTEDRLSNNYFLILALLSGWWFTSFFLRPFQEFSFFTVMIQRVLFGDMFRFFTVILLEFVAFSAAMYITFLRSPGVPPLQFQDVGRTALTMFKLMLGLEELDIFYEAHDPWLAILLFVFYVLVTYTLMLNALIALMSNTCSVVSKEKESHWLLQKLSVLLFIEASLPPCWVHITGEKKDIVGRPRIYKQIKAVSEKSKDEEKTAQGELMASHAFNFLSGEKKPSTNAHKGSDKFLRKNHRNILTAFQNAINNTVEQEEVGSSGEDRTKNKEGRKSRKEKKSKKKASPKEPHPLSNSMPMPTTGAQRPVFSRSKSLPLRVTPRRQPSALSTSQPALELYVVNSTPPAPQHMTHDDVKNELAGWLDQNRSVK